MAEGTRTGVTPPTSAFDVQQYAAVAAVERLGPRDVAVAATTNRVKNIRVGNAPA